MRKGCHVKGFRVLGSPWPSRTSASSPRCWSAVVAMALMAGACSGERLESAPIVIEPAASVTASDLDAAVRVASAALLDVAGIEVVQVEEVDGVVASRLWMDYRPEFGEFVAIESVDTLIRSRGRDEDGGVLTTTSIFVGNSLFQAVAGSADMPQAASTPWQAKDRVDPEEAHDFLCPFIDLTGMAAGEYTSDRTALDTYRRETASGGTEWILVSPFGEGTTTQRWLIDEKGNLETYSVAFEGDRTALDGPEGVPSTVQVTFTPIGGADPIAEPTVGEPLELDDGTVP